VPFSKNFCSVYNLGGDHGNHPTNTFQKSQNLNRTTARTSIEIDDYWRETIVALCAEESLEEPSTNQEVEEDE